MSPHVPDETSDFIQDVKVRSKTKADTSAARNFRPTTAVVGTTAERRKNSAVNSGHHSDKKSNNTDQKGVVFETQHEA